MANIIVKGGTCDEYVRSLSENENFRNKTILVTDTALCDDGLLLMDNSDEFNSVCTVIPMDILEELFRRIIHKISLPPEEEAKS